MRLIDLKRIGLKLSAVVNRVSASISRLFRLSEKSTFDETFPEIEDVSAEISLSVQGADIWPMPKSYDKNSLEWEGKVIKPWGCESECDGGIPIASILRNMVSTKQTELEVIDYCDGTRADGKNIDKCSIVFKVNISIKYKEGKA